MKATTPRRSEANRTLSRTVGQAADEPAIALARPMFGAQMAGDPWIADLGARDPLLTRRACQYATLLLRRDEPSFGENLHHLFAAFEPPATVVFRTMVKTPRRRRDGPRALVPIGAVAPDGRAIVVATIVLPPHVIGARPGPLALPSSTAQEIRP